MKTRLIEKYCRVDMGHTPTYRPSPDKSSISHQDSSDLIDLACLRMRHRSILTQPSKSKPVFTTNKRISCAHLSQNVLGATARASSLVELCTLFLSHSAMRRLSCSRAYLVHKRDALKGGQCPCNTLM